MKKKILICMMTGMLFLFLTGCCLKHDWQEATCTEPQTCSKCGKTEGEALGHTWQEATCTEPQICSACGETEGAALGHKWEDATAKAPKTCSACEATEGDALTPEKCIHALLQLYMRENTDPMKALLEGGSQEELLEAFLETDSMASNKAVKEMAEGIMQEMDGYGLEESDYRPFVNAMVELLRRVTYEAEVVSEDEDKAVVKVKVSSFRQSDLDNAVSIASDKLTENVQNNMTMEEAVAVSEGDMTPFVPYLRQYLQDVADQIGEMQPAGDPSEFEVECEIQSKKIGNKERQLWMPAEMKDLTDRIDESIIR